MAEIRLLKMKLVKKEKLSVEYSRVEKDRSVTIISEDHAAEVHQDLKDAFIGLYIHFAILSDYLTVKQVKDIRTFDSDLIEPFTVSCVHQGGAEDESYIILTGSKITASGRAVTINTPILKIQEEEEKGYKYLPELLERIKQVEKEVREYLQGKHAPETQQSLSFPDQDEKKNKVTHARVATPESIVGDLVGEVNAGIKDNGEKKGKAGRPRKVPQTAQHRNGEISE